MNLLRRFIAGVSVDLRIAGAEYCMSSLLSLRTFVVIQSSLRIDVVMALAKGAGITFDPEPAWANALASRVCAAQFCKSARNAARSQNSLTDCSFPFWLKLKTPMPSMTIFLPVVVFRWSFQSTAASLPQTLMS